jgi:hypothetical protein
VPFFSSQQEDPDVQAAHRALERLNDEVQTLLCDVMTDAVELTPAQARDLARFCRVTRRRLRELGGGE